MSRTTSNSESSHSATQAQHASLSATEAHTHGAGAIKTASLLCLSSRLDNSWEPAGTVYEGMKQMRVEGVGACLVVVILGRMPLDGKLCQILCVLRWHVVYINEALLEVSFSKPLC